jgi:hypothetical protein
VLDFGLARLAERPSGLTAEGQVAGTPQYMSPEQIDRPDSVDARTDVYGLGVTLYEMLTGAPRFRGTTAAVLRQVVAEEARPPRQLNEAVPRDLETVCLKALAKEPARRYQSARELAEDLRRWQRGEPIRARPTGRLEKLWLWCRRNPWAAGLTAALLLVLLAGGTGVVWQWLRAEDNAAQALREAAEARRQTAEAQRQEGLARENLRDACGAVDEFMTGVSNSPPLQAPGLEGLRKKLLQGAAAYYQRFLKQHGDDANLEQEAAAAFRLAGLTWEIGSSAEAVAACTRAAQRYLALADKVSDPAPALGKLAGSPQPHRDHSAARRPNRPGPGGVPAGVGCLRTPSWP